MTPTADDQIIREGAAIGAIDARQPIAVAGSDRAGYLQGLLTNDIQALRAGTGCYAAWLTPQGRMLTDMHVLQSDTMILLDVPALTAESTLQRLDQFLFSEDVQIASLAGSMTTLAVHGPLASSTLTRVLPSLGQPDVWAQHQHERATFDGQPVVVARIDQVGVPGFSLYLAPAIEQSLHAALVSGGGVPVSAAALEVARIEAGYPLFGVDMTEDTIPLEAGIQDRAISMTKGCYVGQEVIVRVLHRGGGRVARKLVSLHIDDDVPPAGAKIVSASREIGWITSAARSPRLGPIALGYVHRDFVTPGTAVQIQSGEQLASAVVTSR